MTAAYSRYALRLQHATRCNVEWTVFVDLCGSIILPGICVRILPNSPIEKPRRHPTVFSLM